MIVNKPTLIVLPWKRLTVAAKDDKNDHQRNRKALRKHREQIAADVSITGARSVHLKALIESLSELEVEEQFVSQICELRNVKDGLIEAVINTVYRELNNRLFNGQLDRIEKEVEFAPRLPENSYGLTVCYLGRRCRVRLHTSLRNKREQLIRILGHELVHVFLHITGDSDRDSEHGTNFWAIANLMNSKTDLNIVEKYN